MILLGVLMAAAPLAAADSTEHDFAARQCAHLTVTSPQSTEEGVFSATKIQDLELHAFLNRKVRGTHLLELKVYTPAGHLYQVFTVSLPGKIAPRPRETAGFSEEEATRQGRGVEGEGAEGRPDGPPRNGLEVTQRLPVAGTWIQSNSLYGRWSVRLHLDQSPRLCGRPASFTITQ